VYPGPKACCLVAACLRAKFYSARKRFSIEDQRPQAGFNSDMKWVAEFGEAVSKQPCVLVTLCVLSGSAPRASGSRMVVTRGGIFGSIGGGNLEFEASGKARELLLGQAAGYQEKQLYGLGPALNQCCGGAVSLLFEVHGPGAPGWLDELLRAQDSDEPAILATRVDGVDSYRQLITPVTAAEDTLPSEVVKKALELMQAGQDGKQGERFILVESPVAGTPGKGSPIQSWWLESVAADIPLVMLFGAGHVGQAVAQILSPLPFRVTWVDSRKGLFPPGLSASFESIRSDDPVAEVAAADPGSIFVVMTHSHQMDQEICLRVLQRDDFDWLGLIGSATKRRRFVHRLGQSGIEPDQLERLVCPIGLSSIRGKQPATIALSLAAQLMSRADDLAK
jgi:xanthine dehydrogenase accessory factor